MSTRVRVSAGLVALIVVGVVVAARSSTSTANFADHEEVGPNRLAAATLDIERGSRSQDLLVENMAPGDTASATLYLENAGDLPLRVTLSSESSSSAIARHMTLAVGSGECEDAGDLFGDTTELSATTAVSIDGAPVEPGESIAVCLHYALPLTTPNSAQGLSVDHRIIAHAEHALGSVSEP